MFEKELNLKGPAVATIVETMARYELNELHQLSDREEVLEALKLKLKVLPFRKLMTYLKKIEPQHTKTAAHKLSLQLLSFNEVGQNLRSVASYKTVTYSKARSSERYSMLSEGISYLEEQHPRLS